MREFTNAVIEAKDEGILDRDELIRDLLNYLSDSEVKNFLSKYYCEFYGDLAECGKDATIYGSMSVFQTDGVGSTPTTRSKFTYRGCDNLSHLLTNDFS